MTFPVHLGHFDSAWMDSQLLGHVWLFATAMYCSLPGSSIHGILQAKILEWVATSSSRVSSPSKTEPASPVLAGRFFTTEPPLAQLKRSLFWPPRVHSPPIPATPLKLLLARPSAASIPGNVFWFLLHLAVKLVSIDVSFSSMLFSCSPDFLSTYMVAASYSLWALLLIPLMVMFLRLFLWVPFFFPLCITSSQWNILFHNFSYYLVHMAMV